MFGTATDRNAATASSTGVIDVVDVEAFQRSQPDQGGPKIGIGRV
jgi:hypothetical protein